MRQFSFFLLVTICCLILVSACHEEPESLVGIEISRDSLVNTWAIEKFIKDDTIRTEDFAGVLLEIQNSGRLNLIKDGEIFEALWSLRGTALALSIDVTDTLLRELSGVWIALEQSAERIDLVNENPRTPHELTLVVP